MLQGFEQAIGHVLAASPSMVMIFTSRNSVLFTSPQITNRSIEVQQLAAEDAEKIMWQFAAPNTPKDIIAELAELCGNVPIALCLVSKAIANSASAAKVPHPRCLQGRVCVCAWMGGGVHAWMGGLVCACVDGYVCMHACEALHLNALPRVLLATASLDLSSAVSRLRPQVERHDTTHPVTQTVGM